MKVNRFFRNFFRGRRRQPPYRRRRFPRLRLRFPRLRFRRTRPRPPRVRARRVPRLKLPSIKNPFAQLQFNVEDRQGFFIILNWLGYVLLFASAVDYLLIIYPPEWTDSDWQLQTSGEMVNHAWVLLMAIILMYLPTRRQIRRLELNFLSLFRWVALLMGLIFILLLPVGVMSARQVNRDVLEQLSSEKESQQEQLEALEQQVRTEQIPQEQLQRLGEQLDVSQPNQDNIRSALLEAIEQQKAQLEQQVSQTHNERFQELIQQLIRISIGAFLIGVFLIRLWWQTRWVRLVNSVTKGS